MRLAISYWLLRGVGECFSSGTYTQRVEMQYHYGTRPPKPYHRWFFNPNSRKWKPENCNMTVPQPQGLEKKEN